MAASPDSPPPTAADPLRVLVALAGRDAQVARDILARAGVRAEIMPDIAKLRHELRRGAAAAVIAEELLHPRAIEGLRDLLSAQEPWSDLPLIVVGHASDERLPGPAPLGNVTIIDRPVRVRTLLSAVDAALRARRRQYQVANALRQRDEFLAMLGHELRNPLSAISLAAEVLKESDDPGAVAKHQGIVERQVRHLARLVDDLLEVSRVTSGKVSLRLRRLDLNDVVERSAHLCEAAAAGAKLELVIGKSVKPLPIMGDSDRLQQIFCNLLTNSIKYTPAGGKVHAMLRGEGTTARVIVRDTGIGIAPDMLPRIFDLFAQADRSLDRSRGGMGIGLTLARRLVELHGGSIGAASGGVGAGSEITVLLPLAKGPAVSEAAPAAAAPPRTGGRRLILVDDNLDILAGLQEVMTFLGHAVDTCENGVDGLARILAEKPDVAVIDIGLPGMDGFELARRVREALGNQVALVALSGYGQSRDRERARQAGFDEYLAKPVDATAIEAAIARIEARGARGRT